MTWRGRAFGLTIEAEEPIPGVCPDANGSTRRTRWESVALDELDARWGRAQAQPLVDLRHPDGRLFMRVDHDPGLGYRSEAPGFGVHLVAADGSHIQSALTGEGTRRWQRFFFAQVLPLAAAASGLDLLHAGAVAYGKNVFGFVAPSGVGKTSVVTHLVANGAEFVTDDVLALEVADGTVRAHSGVRTVNIDPAELRSLRTRKERVASNGPWATIDGKLQVDVASTPTASSLRGLFFLRRSSEQTFAIERDLAGLGPKILGAAFLPYVRSKARITTHLDVAAAIAGAVPTFSVGIPSGAKAGETAARIREAGAEEGLWDA